MLPPKILWQLVAPVVRAQQLVLAAVRGRRLGQHPLHLGIDGLQASVDVEGGVGLDLASRATTPTRTRPATAHSLRTWVKQADRACWLACRNRAMVL